jgi:MFS family permease
MAPVRGRTTGTAPTGGGSRPSFGVPGARDPRHPFATSPFSRLARAHSLSVAGDALFAVGLAGSVFFSLDFDSARWRVALYLLLTIAPFAVAAPLIGPALDRIRGGRRWVIVGSMAVRAVLCLLVVRHLDSILFYPEAFGMLVLGKAYTISKSAVVPTTVRSDQELVEANSKLTVLSAIAVVVAVIPGGILLKLGGAEWTLGLGVLMFAVATVLALQLPRVAVAVEAPDPAEREELRSAGIFLAASAMGLVRGIVGFLAFMLAFAFKNADAPLWQLGVVAAAAQFGFFVGAVLAPRLRRRFSEEHMVLGNLVVIAAAGVLTALMGGLVAAALLSFIVGATSSSAKQAFDAIVQRDAPDANRGRSFARFETRFQLVWVIGALVPIVVPIPAPVGFALVAVIAAFAAASYALGQSRIRRGHLPPAATSRGWLIGLRRRRSAAATPSPPAGPTGTPPTAPSPPPDRGEPGSSSGQPAGPAPDQAPDPGPGSRSWARPPGSDASSSWAPPPGFVSRPLSEEPTAAAPPGPAHRPSPRPTAPVTRTDGGPWPTVFGPGDPGPGDPERTLVVPPAAEVTVREGAPDATDDDARGGQGVLPLDPSTWPVEAEPTYPEPSWRAPGRPSSGPADTGT